MQALLIGFVVMVGYGLFLLARTLPGLYRAGERKLVYCVIGFALATPLAVWLIARLPEQYMSIWIALPTLILFVVWLCLGYFVASYHKKKSGNMAAGLTAKLTTPPGQMRRNLLTLAVGLAIWLFGVFIGVGNRSLEMCLLCVSMLLLGSSMGSFWRYRKF